MRWAGHPDPSAGRPGPAGGPVVSRGPLAGRPLTRSASRAQARRWRPRGPAGLGPVRGPVQGVHASDAQPAQRLRLPRPAGVADPGEDGQRWCLVPAPGRPACGPARCERGDAVADVPARPDQPPLAVPGARRYRGTSPGPRRARRSRRGPPVSGPRPAAGGAGWRPAGGCAGEKCGRRRSARPEAIGHAPAADGDAVIRGALGVGVHVGAVTPGFLPSQPTRSHASGGRGSVMIMELFMGRRRRRCPGRVAVKPSVASTTQGLRTSPAAVRTRPGSTARAGVRS